MDESIGKPELSLGLIIDCLSLPGFNSENVVRNFTEGEQRPASMALSKRECKVPCCKKKVKESRKMD